MALITVIGAVNVDICGRATERFIPQDSNIGNVSYSLGGVGFNIARDLAALKHKVNFIGAIGNDEYSEKINRECERYHINNRCCLRVGNMSNSIYLYVTDEKGEMVAAINAMQINELITPEFLLQHIEMINRESKALVIDVNIPKESIDYLLNNVNIPIFVDGVSAAKVKKIADVLDKITVLKLNKLEAEELSGVIGDGVEAGKMIIAKGCDNLYVTLGEEGSCHLEKGKEPEFYKSKVNKIVDVTGAGDAFTAGIVSAYVTDNKKDAIVIASKGAEEVLASENNVMGVGE